MSGLHPSQMKAGLLNRTAAKARYGSMLSSLDPKQELIVFYNGLKEALSGNLLVFYFQPKVNLLTNKVDGAEALLRWNRGNPENIRPDEFIPVIESTELIHEIGAWVIRQSCRSCKNWHKRGHKLAIDDFGTCYSNMGYLTRLNVDVLKLDQSFISQIGQSKDSLVVITAIIEMAKVLHMKVVTEGVETNSHREALRRLGCDIGQGFLWSKALPCFALINFLDSFELERVYGHSQAAV